MDLRKNNPVLDVLTEHALEENASIRNEFNSFSYWYVVVMTASQIDINQAPYVDYICGSSRYLMKLLGIWPEERKFNKFSSYVVLTSLSVMILIITIPQTVHLVHVWGDLGKVVENLSMGNITVLIAIVKTIAFWCNGRTLKNLLLRMEENRRETKNQKELKRMMKTARLCRKISAGGIICVIVLLATACIVRIWMNRYTGRMLIVSIYSPYDHLITPNYELTIAGQLMAGCYSGGSYTMVDIFLATLVFHTCGQLRNLKARFLSLHSKGKFGSKAELADIIKKHNALYKFVETIEKLFNYMLLIQMLGCTILLCMQSFQAIVTITGRNLEVLVVQIIFFGTYIGYILLQLYLYCYIGEKLHSESTSMIEAAYECKWYELSPSEARSLILIMVRANTPLRLTAGKFCFLNHELFKNILKTSMSYLSVLYAMMSNDVE